MAKLYLVRHGQAAAGWDSDPDPGLSNEGHQQAVALAERLEPLGPLSLVSSPMRRTRETAAPLAQQWQWEPRIEMRVSEIVAPTTDLVARSEWLREIASDRWSAMDERLRAWRDDIGAALMAMTVDTVVVSHFMVLNAAVSLATGDDRVVSYRPGYCSVTILDNDQGELRLVELGEEASTRVL